MALFRRCADRFQLNVEPRSALDSSMQMVPFSACAIHFLLQPTGIDFWADTKWGDMFMCYQVDSRSPFVLKVYFPSNRRPVTYHELMAIFAPDRAPTVPLTYGLQPILPHIPIPQ
jgi:hypothetical protein